MLRNIVILALSVGTLPCLQGAPTFSVPGFVDETLYQGNGMITMRFDPSGRLWVTEKQGRILVFEPNPGGSSSYDYQYYETGILNAIPDFSTLTPVKSGKVNDFTLDPRLRNDDFAFRYTGKINIASSGQHTFYLSSDDGSKLYINNALVVDYDGPHGAGEKSGNVTLTAGEHDIRVEYFERAGGESLKVQYEGPGLAKGPVAQGVFKSPKVFANLSAQVNTDGERGMTGLALDPDFPNNRYLYVLFSTGTDQRILRLTSNPTFDSLVAGSEKILLSGLPNSNTVHKAGDIGFHPNDPANLYAMLGDDGDRYVVSDLANYNGKLLRIRASDGRGLLTNPFQDGNVDSVRSRIWAHSFRNPYRFAFDPAAPVSDVLYISENGDGTDRIARISIGADGAWPNSGYLQSSTDGKRTVLDTSDPSKTGIVIMRSGPFAPDGEPVLYNARYGGGDRNEVRRWKLTGANFDTLTPIAADNGNAFYSGFTDHGIVSFTTGPDGAIYYTDSGQGPSLGSSQRLGRIAFVGGTAPIADFNLSANSGQSPLQVDFTDASGTSGSTLSSWSWDFGDGGSSFEQNPSHTYAAPGVYSASLLVTNSLGLNHQKNATITVSHTTNLTLTGEILDGRTIPPPPFATPTELRFYQSDGMTPLMVPNGGGTEGNTVGIPAGGSINLAFAVSITGPGIVVTAGEPAGDGVQAAFVGIPLSTTLANQSVTVGFRLSDTMIRGRATDTRGAAAMVDIGFARVTEAAYFGFAGGRDFLATSGQPASSAKHRIVPDALGYYHVPVPTGGGGETFFLDTSADTLSSTHGRVKKSFTLAQGAESVQDLTIGLYDGGTGEADLSSIAETPDVDFDSQIQPLFGNFCVACHNDIATNSGGLDLDPGVSFAELVDHLSTEAPGVKLVDPGNPGRSYLMEKINTAVPQIGTSMRPGDPMALAQRALIRDWISQLSENYNTWQVSAFGTEAGDPETLANADYDNDGYSNLLEFTLMSDPKTAQHNLVSSALSESGELELSFTRNTSTVGVDYLVQTSGSLESGSWTVIASKIGASPWSASPGVSVDENPTTGAVTVVDIETPQSLPKRFIRLEVKQTSN